MPETHLGGDTNNILGTILAEGTRRRTRQNLQSQRDQNLEHMQGILVLQESEEERSGVPAEAQWDWQCLGSSGTQV